jgi:predicted nucleic acid-binding Zn ribbon protein
MPASTPELTPSSVRTLPVVRSCPMCPTPLQGRQTVCSAKCRIARSRQRREAKRADRDAKVRLLLTTALEAVQEARDLLKPEGKP